MVGLATPSGRVGVAMSTMPVRIIGRRLPGMTWSGRSGIHLGVQRGPDIFGMVRGDEGEVTFDLEVELPDDADGQLDFRGPFVHGRRGERFLYLSWGEVDGHGTFAMFRRIKLHLSPLVEQFSSEALRAARRIEAFLELTDPKGRPVSASVRPPWVLWRLR